MLRLRRLSGCAPPLVRLAHTRNPPAPGRRRKPPSSSQASAEELVVARHVSLGNYHAAIQAFLRARLRTNAMHESLITACANVPDAEAAHALLRAMPNPTATAAAAAVSAYCRSRDLPAALSLLEGLPPSLRRSSRLAAPLARAATSSKHPILQRRLRALDLPKPPRLRQRAASAEAALRVRTSNPRALAASWQAFVDDPVLASDTGLLAAAVSSFVAAGAAPRALNAVMTFLRGTRPNELGLTAQALLLTSFTKALAACARQDPDLALRAYDVVRAMRDPLFHTSLPLTGAYFTVLQHARLSLLDTLARIEHAKRGHIQLDERAFSMALGAILRCDARLTDRLAEGHIWVSRMKQAEIPLTVHTYNLLAGQMRYCNDPAMVTALLHDMTKSGVTPTAVTYGLVFSACVIPGDYTSPARSRALPVALWERVLSAMQDHMQAAEIRHTPNSRLSLARAYAHLGLTTRALEEFDAYQKYVKVVGRAADKVDSAFEQMVYNFAHCRECSSDGPHTALDFYQGRPSANVLDALLVACVRTGQASRAVSLAAEFGNADLDETGMRHLLKAHTELRDATKWETTRALMQQHRPLLEAPVMRQAVQELVIAFARAQQREACDDLMALAGIEVSDLEYVLKGREFLKMRRSRRLRAPHGSQSPSSTRSDAVTPSVTAADGRNDQKPGSWVTRSYHDDGVLPLV